MKHLSILLMALTLAWGCDSKKTDATKSGADKTAATPTATGTATGQPTASKSASENAAKTTAAPAKKGAADAKKAEIAKAIEVAKAASAEKGNVPTSAAKPVATAPADFQPAAPADAKKTASGLAYKVLKAGTGKVNPKGTDHVTVHYTGWTTDGKEFDSSVKRGKPAQFPLNGVIKGWTEGLQLMVEGEKTRFWIPANLAYGEKPAGGRPAGLLVFDVELLGIEPPPDPVKLAEKLKTKACACKELQCLQSLRQDGMAMAMAMRSATPAQREIVTKLQAEAKTCVDKLVAKAGLDGSAPAPKPGGPLPKTALIDKAKKIKDDICACKDQACVAKISQSMAAMRGEFAKATEEEKLGMQTLGMEIGKCIQKLMPRPGALQGGAPAPTSK